MTGWKRLRRRGPSPMLGRRMRRDRMAARRSQVRAACAAGLLALLGGCVPGAGVVAEKPDATVDFNAGWKAVAPCAREELANTFSSAALLLGKNSAQLTVFGNYGPSSTIMVIFIQDATPGKAQAIIHAHDYSLFWGGSKDRAVATLEKCKNPPPPGTPAPD